jgi:hypothetical protein
LHTLSWLKRGYTSPNPEDRACNGQLA